MHGQRRKAIARSEANTRFASNYSFIRGALHYWARRLILRADWADYAADALATVWRRFYLRALRALPEYKSIWHICKWAVQDSERARLVGCGRALRVAEGPPHVSAATRSDDATEHTPATRSRRWGPAEEAAFRLDLSAALSGLCDRVRRVVVLRSQGNRIREIGAQLGLTKDQVCNAVKRARVAIGRIMEVKI